jgi:hypothetical protein
MAMSPVIGLSGVLGAVIVCVAGFAVDAHVSMMTKCITVYHHDDQIWRLSLDFIFAFEA